MAERAAEKTNMWFVQFADEPHLMHAAFIYQMIGDYQRKWGDRLALGKALEIVERRL